MSPLNHNMRERASLAAACLLGLIFTAHVGLTAEAAPVLSGGDILRAEQVLTKLRLLYGAADAGDASAYRTLISKLYPGLFVTVAEIRQGDLSTDLSTAVFLAEDLGRKWAVAGAATPDCWRERPDIYQPLCRNLRGGTVGQLLLAKARLHTRWAEAVVRSQRGESDAETARSLSEMAAARANDILLAARVVQTLRTLEGGLPHPTADARRSERSAITATGFDRSGGDSADALRVAGVLLSWMPRSRTFYRLSGARHAYKDGLCWHQKAGQSKRLVISANSFAPDPLKVLGLDAEQADAAAKSNWKSAVKLTRLAEQSLSEAAR